MAWSDYYVDRGGDEDDDDDDGAKLSAFMPFFLSPLLSFTYFIPQLSSPFMHLCTATCEHHRPTNMQAE